MTSITSPVAGNGGQVAAPGAQRVTSPATFAAADAVAAVQVAYGRARRTHSGFAERHNLPTRTFEPAASGAPSHGVRGFLEMALEAVDEADIELAELQDSLMPVEVGDAELRAGLAEVRELIGVLPDRARELLRRWGR